MHGDISVGSITIYEYCDAAGKFVRKALLND